MNSKKRKAKEKMQPTPEELQDLKLKIVRVGNGDQQKWISVANLHHIVLKSGRNHWNEDVNYGGRVYSCPNCAEDSNCVYNHEHMKEHSSDYHRVLTKVCNQCGIAFRTQPEHDKHECPMQRTKRLW